MASPANPGRPPCRLLALPAELRLRIYSDALTAPDRAINIYYSYQKKRVRANLGLGLLRTCRQVHSEAGETLYAENTVLLHADVNVTVQPVIHATQVPAAALARVRSVFVVLDASDEFGFGYGRVDFRPFQRMVRLRRLRVAVVSQPDYPRETAFWTGLLGFVVERVPRESVVVFGSGGEAEKRYAERYCHSWRDRVNIVEVPGEVLMRAAGCWQGEKGVKSGSMVDWREEGDGDGDADGGVDGPRTW